MKKKTLIISLITIAALVTAIAFISRDKETAIEQEQQPAVIRLNDTLTNKMSDIYLLQDACRSYRRVPHGMGYSELPYRPSSAR